MLILLSCLSTIASGADRTFAFGRLLVEDEDVLMGAAGDEYRVLLAQHARALGQPVVGAESVLFDKDDSGDADLLVAATVDVACAGIPRKCELSADWQVLDVRTDSVVYEVVTRYLAPFQVDQARYGRELLKGAASRLFERPGFKALFAEATVAETPPTWTAPLRVARCPTPPAPLPLGLPQAMGTVVVVRAAGRTGSGVMISPDGYALTAAHVVDDLEAVDVELQGGLSLTATVVRVDTGQDIALLDIAGSGHACLPLEPGEVPVGTTLYAIGAPAARGLEFTVTRGIASGYRSVGDWRLLQTDTAINPGNSGGPLVGESGGLAAVVSFKLAAPGLEGLGFGVAASVVMERLGLVFGTTSSAASAELAGRRGRPPAPEKVADPGDPPLLAVSAPAVVREAAGGAPATRVYWSRQEKSVLTGLLIGTAGAATAALGAWGAAGGADTEEDWRTMGSVNGLAWIAAGVLGTVAGGYAANAQITVVREETP